MFNLSNSKYFIVSLTSRAFSIAASFAMTLFLTRTLEIDEVGKFFTLLAVLLGISTVGRFGTETLVLKWSATGTSNLIWVYRLLGISIIGSFVVGIAASPIIEHLLQDSVPIDQVGKLTIGLTLSVVSSGISIFSSAIMRGRGSYASGTFAELGSTYTFFVLTSLVYSTFRATTLVNAFYTYIIACMFTAAWTLQRAIAITSRIEFEHQVPSARNVFSSLASMMTSSLTVYLNVWLPVVLLGFLANSSDVALFVVASRVAGFITLIPSIQVTYLATRFASLYKIDDKLGISEVARQASKVAILAALPILSAIFFAPIHVFKLFGENYPGATLSAQILAASATLVVALGPTTIVILNAGSERVTAVAGSVSLLIAGIAIYYGAMTNGLEGVSVAVFCVNFGTAVVLFSWLFRNLKISTSILIHSPLNSLPNPSIRFGDNK